MNASERITWGGVEFQPDLQNPRKPVRLGVLLLTSSGDHVLLGRQPVLDNRPPEFAEASDMSLELAANWVESMGKDILGADKEKALTRLNERWRWNLYVRPLRIPRAGEQEDLLTLAQQAYQKFVGERFRILSPRRRLHRSRLVHRHTSALPAAWLVSEIMKRSSALGLAARA